MTDMTQIARLVDTLAAIATVLERLGPGGLLLAVLAGPAVVVVVVLLLEYHRSRKTEALVEALRAETAKLMEAGRGNAMELLAAYRADSRSLVECYRTDTTAAMQSAQAYQRETAGFYRDNVVLVQSYERLSEVLQDVVIGNTRALERLTTILEMREGK